MYISLERLVVRWHREMISNRRETSCLLLMRPDVWGTHHPTDWMSAHKPTELYSIKLRLEFHSPSLWWAAIQPTWHFFCLYTRLILQRFSDMRVYYVFPASSDTDTYEEVARDIRMIINTIKCLCIYILMFLFLFNIFIFKLLSIYDPL